jgi:exopolysaccharide biosynthesis polyprenyl glycosylphosphotransferase
VATTYPVGSALRRLASFDPAPAAAPRPDPVRAARPDRPWLVPCFLLGADVVVGSSASLVLTSSAWLLVVGWVAVVGVTGGYRRPGLTGPRASQLRVPFLVLLVTIELGLPAAARPWLRGELLAVLVTLAGTGWATRAITAGEAWSRVAGGVPKPRAVLVGGRGSLTAALKERREELSRSLTLVGAYVLDADQQAAGVVDLALDPGEGLAGLPHTLTRLRADLVLVVPGPRLGARTVRQMAWGLESAGVELCVLSGLPDSVGGRASVIAAGSVPLVHLTRSRRHGWQAVVKAVWERAAALLMLVVAAPFLALLGLLIRLDSPGPTLYRQLRVGRDERLFTMYKLRTMTDGAHDDVAALGDLDEGAGLLFKVRADPRVTRVGRVLRRFSLDELPQLWNVVRGDMALVGPRPPLPEEVARYDRDVYHRLVVKPGLTGLWQVSGRSDLSWAEAVRLDLHYVDSWTLTLDLRILLRTFVAVLSHRGAY